MTTKSFDYSERSAFVGVETSRTLTEICSKAFGLTGDSDDGSAVARKPFRDGL